MSFYHEQYLPYDPRRKIAWKAISAYLMLFIGNQKSILELGAGYCECINSLRAKEKTAVDIWSGFRQFADADVATVVQDLRIGLGKLKKRQYDVIIASNFLEHLMMKEATHLLDECHNCLKKNGRIILIQPNFRYAFKHYFDDYTHQTIYTDKSLGALLMSTGFSVFHQEPRFLPLTFKTRLPVWQWLIAGYLYSPWRPLAGQMLLIAEKDVRHVE
jgi:hypothetical protein